MPPESLWIQYSLIGILILAAGLIATAFYKLWRELLVWLAAQDLKREEERDKQRVWEAAQNKERDERWQSFLEAQQKQWLTQEINNVNALLRLIEKVENLTVSINNHDTWARAQDGK